MKKSIKKVALTLAVAFGIFVAFNLGAEKVDAKMVNVEIRVGSTIQNLYPGAKYQISLGNSGYKNAGTAGVYTFRVDDGGSGRASGVVIKPGSRNPISKTIWINPWDQYIYIHI